MRNMGTIYLAGALASFGSGCGAGAISGEETGTSETSTTTTTDPSTTETETGEIPTPPEPLECSEYTCGPILDGPLAALAGTEPDSHLRCLLGSLGTVWWRGVGALSEVIDGQTRLTEFHTDGVGGVLVMQWVDDVPTRVEHCEVQPPEFFAACEQDFDETCANIDNWLGACTNEDPSCPEANHCSLDLACIPLELGDGEGEVSYDPTCVWTALRDAELLDGRLTVHDTLTGWTYETVNFYLDAQSRNVGVTRTYFDDVSGVRSIYRCDLRPAVFFESCLVDPMSDDCDNVSAWYTDCVEQPISPCANP